MPKRKADPDVAVGDWFVTLSSLYNAQKKARPVCKEYSSPPNEKMDGQYRGTFGQSQYIGPVRRIIYFQRFVTVEIESAFAKGEIGYVNIANGNNKFARIVPREEANSWKAQQLFTTQAFTSMVVVKHWTDPDISVGDWFVTFPSLRDVWNKRRPVCKEYSSPPCDLMDGQYRGTFGQSQYIGPVRRVIRVRSFVTVEIKSAFAEGEIGYVNIAYGNNQYAELVPREAIDSWKVQGWVDDIWDGTSGSTWGETSTPSETLTKEQKPL